MDVSLTPSDSMNIPRLTAAWLLVPLAIFIPNVCLGQEVAQLTVGRLSDSARPQIDGRVDDEYLDRLSVLYRADSTLHG